MKIKSPGTLLPKILAYRNAKVVERYEEELKLTHAEAMQLFEDVKLFLFIAGTTKTDKMICPPRKIDLGWHEFIMFTEDYMNFCDVAFGQYLHHRPFTKADKATRKREVFEIGYHAKGLLAEIGLEVSDNWKMGKNHASHFCMTLECTTGCDLSPENQMADCVRCLFGRCDQAGNVNKADCQTAGCQLVKSAECEPECEPRGDGVCMSGRAKNPVYMNDGGEVVM